MNAYEHYTTHLRKNPEAKVMLPGPDGLLEGKMFLAEGMETPLALIFHPHPLHGGTMNNKVVHTLTKTFQQRNFNTLRINFRGVGKSQGISVGGDQELDDALNALDWFIHQCEKKHGDTPPIWVAGFSFGGWIALQAAMRRPEIAGFVSIGTPVETYNFNMLTPCPNGIMIQGEEDHIVSVNAAQALCDQLIRQKGCQIDFKSIKADHYFTNHLGELANIVEQYLEKTL